MEVAIAGGHKIGMLLGRLLVERGDSAFGLIRKPSRTTICAGRGSSRSSSTSRVGGRGRRRRGEGRRRGRLRRPAPGPG